MERRVRFSFCSFWVAIAGRLRGSFFSPSCTTLLQLSRAVTFRLLSYGISQDGYTLFSLWGSVCSSHR